MSKFSLPVEEYTTPDPVTSIENATIDDLSHLMKTHGIRHIPILSKNRVVGIVSERDIKVATGLSLPEKRQVLASDIMAKDPVTVSSQDGLDTVAFEMSKQKIGSVIVNDENEKFLGIFTATDALNALIEIVRSSK